MSGGLGSTEVIDSATRGFASLWAAQPSNLQAVGRKDERMKKKQATPASASEAPRKRGRPPKLVAEVQAEPEKQQDDDGFGPEDLLSLADLRSTHEPDPREIDSLTDRIFGSVLSRYGWDIQNGHIEHVGEGHSRQGH
jgi:hypothetical protein